MISRESVKKDLEQYISDAYNSSDFIGTLIKHPFFHFLTQSYDELDDELKTFVDKTFDSLTESAKENIEKMPDSIEKRQAKRSLKKISRTF
jgi:Dissimilatory sulfite reductase (desulfoviridin), alpha and beta subunits